MTVYPGDRGRMRPTLRLRLTLLNGILLVGAGVILVLLAWLMVSESLHPVDELRAGSTVTLRDGRTREALAWQTEMVEQASREVLVKGFSALLSAHVPYVHLNPLFTEIPELDPNRGGTLIGASRAFVDPSDTKTMDEVADRLGCGFTPVRKPGKLPSKTVRQSYALEYGTDALEMHADAVGRGQLVLIVDDLLATGGTARATADLVRHLGGEVQALAFLIELKALNGRQRLRSESVHTVLTY